MSNENEEPEVKGKEFDLKNWAKHFLPALLALVIAATGWFDSNRSLSASEENQSVEMAKLKFEVDRLKLNTAEFIGEQRSQRELITDLRLDIREIKTILESMNEDKKRGKK